MVLGKWKVILGMGMQFTWPFGRGLAVVVAWIFPNWRTIFQVEIFISLCGTLYLMKVVSAPCILAPILLYFLPESPRWLIAKGRISNARWLKYSLNSKLIFFLKSNSCIWSKKKQENHIRGRNCTTTTKNVNPEVLSINA